MERRQQGLGGIKRSFFTSNHKRWGECGEHTCRSSEVALPGALCVLCLLWLFLRGQFRGLLAVSSGGVWQNTVQENLCEDLFFSHVAPSAIYLVIVFHFPLFPFCFYFITAKSKLGVFCVFHLCFEGGTCKILSPVT